MTFSSLIGRLWALRGHELDEIIAEFEMKLGLIWFAIKRDDYVSQEFHEAEWRGRRESNSRSQLGKLIDLSNG